MLLGAALLTSVVSSAAAPTKAECIASNETAQDLQRAGKLREARQKLAACVAKSCPGPVREDCTERLADVDKAMPTIIVAATDADGNDLSAVRVFQDGALLVGRLDGTPVDVDPGVHMFRFEAAGYLPVTRKLVIRETEKERRLSIAFTMTRAQDDSSSGGDDSANSESTEATRPTPWPAYASLGVGGAGLVTGIIFAISAIGQRNIIDKDCAGLTEPQCNQTHPGEQDRLTTDNIAMGVGFAVAAIGGGVGAYLLLSAPSAPSQARSWWVAPRIGLGWAGLQGGFQ